MADVVARCPDCGREHPDPFARCDWCGRSAPSRWWCLACSDWRPARTCPACAGGLRTPSELSLGECIAGATVPFRFAVWNLGRDPIDCDLVGGDGVLLHTLRLFASEHGTATVRGELRVPPGASGRHAFRVAFDTPDRCETLLTLDVVPPAPRLEFAPAVLLLRAAAPGGVVRSSVALKNSGNVELAASLSSAAAWLVVETPFVILGPGESAEIKLRAKSKKTDSGPRETTLTATAGGESWGCAVRFALPEPILSAAPVEFGELKPGKPAFADVAIRNIGRVRVNGTVSVEAAWLRASPARMNLPPGREKTVRLRASLAPEDDGPLSAELVVECESGVVLRVPVGAVGNVPRPILRDVRRQRFRDAVGAPVERKFQIANDGDGRLDLTASSDVPWLKVETPELRVAAGKKRKLRYTVDLPALERGEHTGTISLASNGGSVAVPVTVEVLDPNPLLDVALVHDLGLVTPYDPLVVPIPVRNAGVGLLRVRAEAEDSRASVSPRTLEVQPGPPARLHAVILVAGLVGGAYETAVRIASNGGEARAVVRFKLPTEHIDAPSLIDLGVRESGVATGGAVRVRNTGPYPVTLALRAETAWLRPGAGRVTIPPRESTVIAFGVDTPEQHLGPLVGGLVLEGRVVRQRVAVRLIAARVELVAEPDVIDLDELTPGAQRRFSVSILNTGLLPAYVPDAHADGELAVWTWSASVRPGERVTLHGIARVNATQTGQRVRTELALGHDLRLRCEARVVAPLLPKVLAGLVAGGGVTTGAVLAVAVAWWLGVPLGLLTLLLGAWLFWRAG